MKTFVMLLLFCTLLCGCGQTGSLYLPQTEQPAASTTPKTEAPNDQQ